MRMSIFSDYFLIYAFSLYICLLYRNFIKIIRIHLKYVFVKNNKIRSVSCFELSGFTEFRSFGTASGIQLYRCFNINSLIGPAICSVI